MPINLSDVTITYRTNVTTPIGPGQIDAKVVDSDKWLVVHARDWFSPDDWAKLSPLNGPTIFRQYTLEELDIHPTEFPNVNPFKPRSASWNDVVTGATETMKTKPSTMKSGAGKAVVQTDLLDKVRVGSVWKTRKNGDFYIVESVVGPVVKISWLGGSYKRDVTPDNLATRYDFVSASRQEGM